MTINLSLPGETELKPRITVIGVGGAGGNAVNNMISADLDGVEFVVANTDSQALGQSKAGRRIQLGASLTGGLGAGARPDVGRGAAEEAMEEISAALEGSNMVFITAGLGGGTGTGAAPVIARAARERGILTVGVVTKPFHFEGMQRMRIAEAGLKELQSYVDTLIVIPNQNLFRVANEKTTFADAFAMADNVLHAGVRGVTDLMVMPGMINLDFADIRTVMAEMGKAMMGTGEAEGERRSLDAAEAAISNPLLDDVSMKGARGVLINITGGDDLTLFEVDEAANRIRDEVDPEANIIFGSTFDAKLTGRLRISVIATGIEVDAAQMPRTLGTLPPVREPAPKRPVLVASQPAPTATMAVAQTALAVTVAGGAATAQALAAPAPVAIAAPAAQAEAAPVAAAEPADVFTPPRAVEPPTRRQKLEPAEPFAAAALASPQANVAKAAPERPKRSLFERITGSGRGRPQPLAAPAPAPVAPPPAPSLDLRAQPAPARPEPQRPRELGAVAAGDRLANNGAEDEDYLDIPAFLRRQAN